MFLVAVLLLIGATTARLPGKRYHDADNLTRDALKYSGYHSGLAKKLDYSPEAITAPEEFDWRDHGVVTPVKDQGQCRGANWIFSAIGHIEGQYAIKHKKCIDMSAQQVLDCVSGPTYVPDNCYETLPHYIFSFYLLLNGGVFSEESYPWTGLPLTHSCRMFHNNSGLALANITDVKVVAPRSETNLRQLLYETGPLVVGLDGTSLDYYKKGIFVPSSSETKCIKNINRFMLLVGYGIDNGTKYWTLKNSWGEKWGENGYFRIERDRKEGILHLPAPACSMGVTYTAMCTVT